MKKILASILALVLTFGLVLAPTKSYAAISQAELDSFLAENGMTQAQLEYVVNTYSENTFAEWVTDGDMTSFTEAFGAAITADTIQPILAGQYGSPTEAELTNYLRQTNRLPADKTIAEEFGFVNVLNGVLEQLNSTVETVMDGVAAQYPDIPKELFSSAFYEIMYNPNLESAMDAIDAQLQVTDPNEQPELYAQLQIESYKLIGIHPSFVMDGKAVSLVDVYKATGERKLFPTTVTYTSIRTGEVLGSQTGIPEEIAELFGVAPNKDVVPDAPTVDPVEVSDKVISGTGEYGYMIEIVFETGEKVQTMVKADGTWSIEIPIGINLTPGSKLTASQSSSAATSDPVTATVVPDPVPVLPTVEAALKPEIAKAPKTGEESMGLYGVLLAIGAAGLLTLNAKRRNN